MIMDLVSWSSYERENLERVLHVPAQVITQSGIHIPCNQV